MDLFYVNGESEGYEDVARIQLSQAQETDSKSWWWGCPETPDPQNAAGILPMEIIPRNRRQFV